MCYALTVYLGTTQENQCYKLEMAHTVKLDTQGCARKANYPSTGNRYSHTNYTSMTGYYFHRQILLLLYI